MYPLAPGILILDVVQTRSLLDWSHAGAFDFSRLCLYQHWCWGKGGNSLNPIQASENIMLLETDDCTSSVPTWYRKNGVWSLIMAWWRMKRVSRFAGWRMELYADIHLGCSSICRRVGGHIHWEIFFLAPRHFFGFGQFVSLSTEAIFSFNFWEGPSIVSLGEAKNGFIFEIKFWLRVWSQSLSFLEFVASNSRLACLGSDRMRAERVVAALLWFYKHDSGS